MPDWGKDFLISGIESRSSAASRQAENLAAQLKNSKNLANANKNSTLSKGDIQAEQLAKADEAATQFEALLLQQMFKEMWKSVPGEGLFSGSREEAMYRDMLNEALGENIAKEQSIGIKDVILKELKEKS